MDLPKPNTPSSPSQNPVPGRSTQASAKIEAQIKAIPKETAQEAVHQVMTKESAKAVLKKPVTQVAEEDAITLRNPSRTAKGSNDVMSQQAQQTLSSMAELKSMWKQQPASPK